MGPKPERSRRALRNVGGPVRTGGDRKFAQVARMALERLDARSPDDLTHGFHSYPARMHPAIAATLIDALAAPGAVILDPFCGSGTVLVESRLFGCAGVGVDLNPLALRLAEVKCDARGRKARDRFLATLGAVAEASEARVRARVEVRAPLSREEARWYDPHVLKELAGLREEIRAVRHHADRRALEALLSAIVVKFSRQRADTSERAVPRRVRKGLPTEFFLRKGSELVDRWAVLAGTAPRRAPRVQLVEGDARRLRALLGPEFQADLVITSPPYGGTYDYASHHARRLAWLGLDAHSLDRHEIGARRHLRGRDARTRWDTELRDALRAVSHVLAPSGLLLVLLGDAQLGGGRVDATEQLRRLAPSAHLSLRASASQARPDWTGGPARKEHLLVLTRE